MHPTALIPELNRALAMMGEGRAREGMRLAAEWALRYPNRPEPYGALSTLASKLGDADDSLKYIERAYALRPGDPAIIYNYAGCLSLVGRQEEALEVVEAATAHYDDEGRLPALRAELLYHLGRWAEAAEAAEDAVARHPESVRARLVRFVTTRTMDVGRARELLQDDARELNYEPELLRVWAMETLYEPTFSEAEVAEAHLAFARRMNQIITPGEAPQNLRQPERKLRVGFVSSDFRRHVVCSFILPVLKGLDPREFELYAYATGGSADEMTKRVAKQAKVIPFHGIYAVVAAKRILHDRIDILIDLNGLTAEARHDIFALRPAPIQLTYLGYPHSTGLACYDGRVVDSITDVEGNLDAGMPERLVRLEPPFLAYEPRGQLPDVRERDPVPDALVFASFNAASKHHDRVFELWARLLHATPGSRLVLKHSTFTGSGIQARVREAFARHGLADRVSIHGGGDSDEAHLGHFHAADVQLDTFPYSGTTTTIDTVLMGVPFVTLAGRTHRSRVGQMIATVLGFPEWIGQTEHEYLSLAQRLAVERPTRAEIRQRYLASPFNSPESIGRRFGAALRDLWREHCAG